MNEEILNLAAWSRDVRGSSLKRLRLVPPGSENWRPVADAMSFADLACHLLEADQWLFKKLLEPALRPMRARAGCAELGSHTEYGELLDRLEQSGEQRSDVIRSLSREKLLEPIHDERFGGAVTVWWVIVRGNLDHEAHHRGQIAAYLRIAHIVG